MSKIVKYQKFIRNFWLISFCLIVTLAKAGDWSQWFHTTPGNNIISNESMNNRHRNVFTCSENHHSIHYLEKWYFYKGNIIGSFEESQPAKYFILNENNCFIDSFANKVEFNNALRERKLKPLIWEKWFEDNWGFFFEGDGHGGLMDWFFLRGTWLVLPSVFMLGIGIMLNKIQGKFGRLICSGIVLVTIARIFLDLYPMSL